MIELTEVLAGYPARLIMNAPVSGDRLAQYLRRESQPGNRQSSIQRESMHGHKPREGHHG